MGVTIMDGRLRFGERLVVSFHRTLRVPEQGGPYALPAGFGLFPMEASQTDEILVPMHSREALWIGFSAAHWKPSAVVVIAGGINAVTGLADRAGTLGMPQNYMVCPDQPWLDGCNIGDGLIRQFVAMPLGHGYGLGSMRKGGERGGLDIIGFDPLPGHFPDAPPSEPGGPMRMMAAATGEMTLSAGGRLHQKIYPDRFGPDIWDTGSAIRARVRLVAARDWLALTGTPAPASPIDARTYAEVGLPWFDLDDADEGSVAPGAEVPPRTVGERDLDHGLPATDPPIEVHPRQVTVIGRHKPTTKT